MADVLMGLKAHFRRIITLGVDSFDNQVGYRSSFGSVSDDSYGGDTITILFQDLGDRFFLRMDNDALAQDEFTKIILNTKHLGIVTLESDDVVFFGGSGFSSWEWEVAEDIYRLADVGEILGWDILPLFLKRAVTVDGSAGGNSDRHGYERDFSSGSIDDESLPGATITMIVNKTDANPDFRVKMEPGDLPQDFFTDIHVEHSGGVMRLETASADGFTNNTGNGDETQWRWDNPPTNWDASDDEVTYNVFFKLS